MKEKNKDTFYLFTLVNISEDGGLNGEFENKLFRSYKKARHYMENSIDFEISIQETENDCPVELERIDDNLAYLWLNTDCSEGVTYSISRVRPV